MEEMESVWLWIGTVGMALGALAFALMGRSADEGNREFYTITTLIPLIAAASYLAMALGQGVAEVDGRTVYWARYVDWLFTTPLLLLDLALLARAGRNLIFGLIAADVFMIATGLVATLSPTPINFVWWVVSTGAFVAILFGLLGQLSANARNRPGEVGSVFSTLRNLTAVLWTAYPIVWLLGTEGFGLVGLGIEVLLFMILDLSAKVGFGFLLLSNRAALQRTGISPAQTAEQPLAG
jgi:bacteriorhodopsin